MIIYILNNHFKNSSGTGLKMSLTFPKELYTFLNYFSPIPKNIIIYYLLDEKSYETYDILNKKTMSLLYQISHCESSSIKNELNKLYNDIEGIKNLLIDSIVTTSAALVFEN